MHNQTLEIQTPENTTSISWKLDYFKNSIELPKNLQDIYVLLFMNIGNGTLQMYLKTLQPKCIQAKLLSKTNFELATSVSVYENNQQ